MTHAADQSSSAGARRSSEAAAIILAAGKGTRMNSDLPKVVHPVADQPMVRWVVQAAREVGASPIVLVVGHGAEHVRSIFTDERDVQFVMQQPQLGTGHAVDQARPILADSQTDVIVLAGDGPLIRAETLRIMLDAHRNADASATLATAVIDDPAGYGRIVRDASGRFERIVEQKDASPEELAISEINPSYYCFKADVLFDMLSRIDNDNASGEYYITDVFALMRDEGHRIEVIDAVPPEDVLSINTPDQLAEVSAILQARLEATGAAG